MDTSIRLVSQWRLLAIWILMLLCFPVIFYINPLIPYELVRILILIVFVYLLFTIPIKYAQYKLKLNFSYASILVGNEEYLWSEVKSYKIEHSQFIETLTIKLLNGKKLHFAGFVDGKKSKDFQNLKVRFLQIVNHHNKQEDTNEIIETGFYTTKFAKYFIVIGGVIVAVITIKSILSGQLKQTLSLLMIVSLMGVMIPQIFKKRKNKANNP